MTKTKETVPLTGRQKKFLRGLGHHLVHSVIVGREGLSESLIRSCADSIQAHELIKVKLGQNCPLQKRDAAQQLALLTGAQLIQLIGRTVLLFRQNPELPADIAIHLPR